VLHCKGPTGRTGPTSLTRARDLPCDALQAPRYDALSGGSSKSGAPGFCSAK
jgi:hypothetical protein